MSNLKYKSTDDCARISHSIGVYVDGELDPAHAIELEAHVLACSACTERVATLQAMRKSLKRTSSPRCPDMLRAPRRDDRSRAATAGGAECSATSSAGTG